MFGKSPDPLYNPLWIVMFTDAEIFKFMLDYTKCRDFAQHLLYVGHLCHRYLRTHDEAHRRLWFLWSADGTNTKTVGRCGCIGGCAFFGSNRNGAKFFKPSRQDIQDGINMATFR